MSSTVDARDAIVNLVESLWRESEFSDIGLYGGNGPAPKMDSLQKFANYEVRFRSSEQVTLGENPVDRTWGSIEFQFGTREGTGVRALLVMQAYMKEGLKAKSFGPVRTLIPSPQDSPRGNGWAFETLYVPFYFDSSPAANTHQ